MVEILFLKYSTSQMIILLQLMTNVSYNNAKYHYNLALVSSFYKEKLFAVLHFFNNNFFHIDEPDGTCYLCFQL